MTLFDSLKRARVRKRLKIAKPNERYDHLEFFEGGMSLVAKSFDRSLHRVVAKKELQEKYIEDESMLQSFLYEARLVSYLDHPGVTSIYDVFIQGNAGPCYTMKYIKGNTLDKHLYDLIGQYILVGGQSDGVPLAQCLRIFERICETMAYVHDRGVIHLDLKPQNIIIGEYGEVLIIDWGSGVLYDPEPYKQYLTAHAIRSEYFSLAEDSEKTSATGSPMYMSPEQTWHSRETLKPSSDIFSAGVVLYQMCTGTAPFTGKEINNIKNKVRHYHPPAVHELNIDIPTYLSHICSKMIEKDAENRYKSFHEVLFDLDELRNSGLLFPTKTYEAGEVIFNEGEPGTYSFIILSGRVDISKYHSGRKVSIAELGKHEIVGELAIFSDEPRSATATAIEPTTIRIMSRKEINQELEKLAPWVSNMVSGLSDRFIELNQKLITLSPDPSGDND